MRHAFLTAVCLVALATKTLAAPPSLEIPPVVTPSGQYIQFVPKTDGVSVTYVGLSGIEPVPTVALANPKMFLLDTYGKPAGTYKFAAIAAGANGEQTRQDFSAVIGQGPAPDPKPAPTPDPKPPPEPVTSFRVFLVYEAGATLNATQYGIIYGIEVEKALTSATTGSGLAAEKTGWRRTDKDANPATMTAGFKDVWSAAKPKVTTVPCIVFQVNQQVTIEPLPASVADTTALIAKYRGK